MHREIKAMKEAGDREIALELESILGWWDLASTYLGKSSDQLGMFYLFFTVCTRGLMRIGVVDEQHLMLHTSFCAHVISSIKRFCGSFHFPSHARDSRIFCFILSRSIWLRPMVLQHNNTHPARLLHRRQRGCRARVQANGQPSSVSPSAPENIGCQGCIAYTIFWPLLTTPSSDPESARMEMDDQTVPVSPVELHAVDKSHHHQRRVIQKIVQRLCHMRSRHVPYFHGNVISSELSATQSHWAAHFPIPPFAVNQVHLAKSAVRACMYSLEYAFEKILTLYL